MTMMEPNSEWIVHFIWPLVSNHSLFSGCIAVSTWTYLDIREVGIHNTIHHAPDVRDRVLVSNADVQLVSDE
jgi:hypothetical protein